MRTAFVHSPSKRIHYTFWCHILREKKKTTRLLKTAKDNRYWSDLNFAVNILLIFLVEHIYLSDIKFLANGHARSCCFPFYVQPKRNKNLLEMKKCAHKKGFFLSQSWLRKWLLKLVSAAFLANFQSKQLRLETSFVGYLDAVEQAACLQLLSKPWVSQISSSPISLLSNYLLPLCLTRATSRHPVCQFKAHVANCNTTQALSSFHLALRKSQPTH